MPLPVITGITVSVSFGDKEYGKGLESFENVQAKWSESNAPTIDNLDEVIDSGMELYFAAWKTMLGTRFATGLIDAETFKTTLQNSELRLASVRKFLRKGVIQP